MSKNIPQTSKDAYKSLDPDKINEIHKRILDALKIIGKGHYEDIAKAAKADAGRVWKRLSELHKGGLIERTGERKALSSGRDGFVWTLTEKGQPVAKVTERFPVGTSSHEHASSILKQTVLF